MARERAKLTADDLTAMPPEVRQLVAPLVVTPLALAEISKAIAKRRDAARSARTASGIEAVWTAAEEAYVGIDDANRGEWQEAKWTKPMSVDGPVTTGESRAPSDERSTVFVPVTARYVNAGAAKLSEILLPVDDKAFSFEPMPEPEVIRAKEDQSQVVHDQMGNMPLTRPMRADEVARQPSGGNVIPFPGRPLSGLPGALQSSTALSGYAASQPQPAAPAPTMGDVLTGKAPTGAAAASAPRTALTVADLAEEHIELLRKSAKAAERKVWDWMVESQYPAEVRKVILDSAKLGVGVLKGPYPEMYRAIVANRDAKGLRVEVEEKIKPACKWISPWNLFPDPSCGENIHKGDFCFERDYLSEDELRKLKAIPGYIGTAIDQVIEEGPKGKTGGDVAPSERERDKNKDKFEIFYYYGSLKRDEVASFGTVAPANAESVFVIVSLVNDSVIKVAINPLNSGSFPYYAMPWQRRAGNWAGVGIGEQLRTAQRMVNGYTRAMNDNAGIAAGPQVVIDKTAIEPADGQTWAVTPNKLWYRKRGNGTGGVKDDFEIYEIPATTNELMAAINYAMQIAEESTSIPLVSEGKSGEDSPETYGGMALLNTNANQLLRSIGYAFDDYVTEPFVRQCYEWYLLDDEVPDEDKGQFRIDAHGSATLVERAISDAAIGQMSQLVLNPAYGADPVRWFKTNARAKRIHPSDLMYSDEERARLQSMPPTDPPVVAAARVRAEAQKEANTATTQVKLSEIHTNAVVDLHELALKERLAMLEYANRNQITLTQTKAELAGTAMKLNTEERLNAQNNALELHRHHVPPAERPPVQAPGRAGNGHAFDQSPAP